AGGETGTEPLRVVAGDPGRSAVETGGVEARALVRGERRRGETPAVGERRDRTGIELALEPQHAERDRARARLPPDVGARGAPAQRVIDEAGDRGAVAGAGEAVREAPVLERIGCRPPPRLDLGNDLDGGGEAGARRHQRMFRKKPAPDLIGGGSRF